MIELNMDYEKKYLDIVKKTVLNVLKKYKCTVFLFGSRAENEFSLGSDIDIGIEGLSEEKYLSIRNKILMQLEESIVPYRIDLVNFDIVDESFKKMVGDKIQVWQTN